MWLEATVSRPRSGPNDASAPPAASTACAARTRPPSVVQLDAGRRRGRATRAHARVLVDAHAALESRRRRPSASRAGCTRRAGGMSVPLAEDGRGAARPDLRRPSARRPRRRRRARAAARTDVVARAVLRGRGGDDEVAAGAEPRVDALAPRTTRRSPRPTPRRRGRHASAPGVAEPRAQRRQVEPQVLGEAAVAPARARGRTGRPRAATTRASGASSRDVPRGPQAGVAAADDRDVGRDVAVQAAAAGRRRRPPRRATSSSRCAASRDARTLRYAHGALARPPPAPSPPPLGGASARGGRLKPRTRGEPEGRRERTHDAMPDTTSGSSSSTPPCATASSRRGSASTAPRSSRSRSSSRGWASTSSRPASRSPRPATSRRCRPSPARCEGPVIAGLARAQAPDIERAWDAVRDAARPAHPHVHLDVGHPHRAPAALNTREDVKAGARAAVAHARSLVRGRRVLADGRHARRRRSSPPRSCRSRIDEGATTINIPDTVGYTMPDEFKALPRRPVRARAGPAGRRAVVHCHDDLGLAVANSLAGVQAGARQIECAVNGIGERAGNASLEELIMLLHTRGEALGLLDRARTRRRSRARRGWSRA